MSQIASLFVKIGADISDFTRKIESSSQTLKKAGEKMKSVGESMSLSVTAPITAIGAVSTKTAIDFESAFAGVRKTVDATEGQFKELEMGIRGMSKTIPASSVAIAGVAEAAGQLGIERENILGFSRVMIDLGESTNLSSDNAATALARLANITQMPQTNFDRLGSTIVGLGNNLATTESEIVEMGLRLAGAGKQVGMTEAQILGFGGALSSVGIAAEAGGTAFSRVFKDMFSAVKTGSGTLTTFASVAGLSVADFKKQFEQDASGAVIKFIEGLGKIGAQGGNTIAVLDELKLSDIRVSDALLRASGAGDLFRKSIEIGTTAWEENTALTKEATERYKTMASQLQITKNHLTEAGLIIGRDLMPMVQQASAFVREMAGRFVELDPGVRKAILVVGAVAAAIGPLLVIVGQATIALSALPAAFAAVKVAMVAVTGPVGITVAAIGAIITAAVLIRQNWEPISDFFKTLWSKVLAATATFYNGFAETIERIANQVIQGFVGFIKEKFGWMERFMPESMKGALQGVSDASIKLPRMVVPAVTQAVKQTAQAIAPMKTQVPAAVQQAVTGAVNEAGLLAAGMSGAGEKAKKAAKTAADKIAETFAELPDKMKALKGQAVAFGDSFNLNAQMASLLESSIKDLIGNGLDPSDKRVKDLIVQWEKYHKASEKVTTKTFDVSAAVADAAKQMAAADDKAKVFGQAFDVNAEKSRILEGAIKKLIDNGVKPSDAAIQQMKTQLDGLAKSTAKTENNVDAFKKSTTDLLSAVNGLRNGVGKIGKAIGLNFNDPVTAAIATSGDAALAFFEVGTSAQAILPAITTMGSTIGATLLPIITTIGGAVMGVLVPAFAAIGGVIMSTVIPAVVSFGVSLMANPIGIIVTAVGLLIIGLGQLIKHWDAVAGFLGGVWSGMVDLAVGVFNGLGDFFKGLWEGIGNGALAAWTWIRDGIVAIWNVLIGILKAPFNFMISSVNAIIGAINKVSFEIPSWVPGIGGAKFGFNIPEIPMLAEGGIVTGPTLAMVGEGRDQEAVLPLNDATFDRLAEALVRALGGRQEGAPVASGGDTYHITIQTPAFVADEAGWMELARLIGMRQAVLRAQRA